MRLYVDLPPGDTRPLPRDPRIERRPEVLALTDGRHPALLADHVARAAAQNRIPWVEAGDLSDVARILEADGAIWIRGLEAGGASGDVGAVVLMRAAHRSQRPWVVQGLGRRGMAAALALGAHAVQVDVHTWLLEDSPLHPEHQSRLRGRSGRDTQRHRGHRRLGEDVTPDWPTRPSSGVPAPTSLGDATDGPPLARWLPAFADELEARIVGLSDHPLRSDPFGTGAPIVQGPMANVSESAGLATTIRAAGGLPFCALGALRPERASQVLDAMTGVPEPWGAGVIGFDVMPHRDAHVALLTAHPGRPVILAGASPALAVRLQDDGLEPWLHTPSARLASLALRRGVRAVVFEGREAGGHVGQVPSCCLWEEGLAVCERHDGPLLVVLAGGIGDAFSSAFAALVAAGAHQAGHRVGLQVGTAFFFTHEIVETGQITPTYQQRALAARRTVYVGDTVGLPLQCAPNEYTERTRADEAAWSDDGVPLTERRERVERRNLGRTRIAAQGIERDGRGGYRRVPIRRQQDEGAFTMGQGALVDRSLRTVAELMADLTTGATSLIERKSSQCELFGAVDSIPVRQIPSTPARRPSRLHGRTSAPEPSPARASSGRIAVVGVGCVLPGAPDVATFWERTRSGLSGVRAVPDERWVPHRYFHPDPGHSPTTSYVRMAGIVEDFAFDPVAFGIPPSVAPSMDRAQQLALAAAAEAVRGLRLRDRRRAAVYLGNSMGGEHAKSLAVRVRFREILAALGRDGDDALDAAVHAHLEHALPPVDVESMSGLLANVIAGRVAAWLDLKGGNATVDAACAASLGAVQMAVDALRSGRADVVLTGGVDADLSPETFVGFCRTHALSPTGSQPFSRDANGFVMGEGAVVLALKRLEDAHRDGDRVLATLLGIGSSSDGRSTGITAPRAEGQVLALQRALADAGVEPGSVEMLEAHGTGTAVGDPTEIRALSRVYPSGWVGSVKSQIGHLKGAAGAAGLLRAVLAVQHGVLPPTSHAGPLHPEVARSPFRCARRARGFANRPRRAAVSAFGFGGTNFHLLVETDTPTSPLLHPAGPEEWGESAHLLVEVFAADTREDLARAVTSGATCTPEEAVTQAHRAVRIGHAPGLAAWIHDGGAGAFGRMAWVGSGRPRRVVAVFPGQGSPREGAAEALLQVPVARRVLEGLEETAPDTSADPAAQHHLLVATGAAYAALLREGTELAGVVGHSVGELAALVGAGRLTPRDALDLADARGRALGACPPGSMLAIQGDVLPLPGCHVAAENSPGSWVAAGPPEAIDAAATRLRRDGVRCTKLDVERAFHTPAVGPAAQSLASAGARVEPTDGLPWWPNVPGIAPDADAAGLREALVRGVTETVGFARSLRAAREAGHTLFVHAGPGGSLARHIERTLPDARVVVLHPDRDAAGEDLVRAAGALLAEGHARFLRLLPGTWCQVAFPREPPRRPEPLEQQALTVAPRIVAPAPPTPAPTPEPRGLPDGPREVVLRAITEVTGYPRSALLSGASLDRDLGVDSIRKLEILGRIQDDLGIELDEGELAAREGLGVDDLVAYIEAGPRRAPTARRSVGLFELTEIESLSNEWSADRLIRQLRAWVTEGAPPDVVPRDRAEAAFLRVLAAEEGREPPVSAGPGVRPALLDQDVPERPVVLASGGVEGILVPCLAALPGARGVILGRRAQAEAPPGFTYVSCDVTDPAGVARAAAVCRERHGPIDLVVHAAGVLRDGPVREAQPDDVDAVLRVKLDGATALFEATRVDRPALAVTFSSVSATLTNPGQALYAAANAALESMRHPTAQRTLPLAWTAWSDVGMAADPTLQRLLAARGIVPIPPDEGAACFVRALRARGPVWIAHAPPPSPSRWPLGPPLPEAWTVPLDPAMPALADHVVGGRPLVPAALWMRALEQVADDDGVGLADFRILGPTVVRTAAEARVERTPEGWCIRVGGRAVAEAARSTHPLPSPPLRQIDVEEVPFDYAAGPLFHGPAWRVLEQVGLGGAIVASLKDARPEQVFDACFQLLALWSLEGPGWLGLPVGAGGWHHTGRCSRLALFPRVDGVEVHSDAIGWNDAGEVVFEATALCSRRATDA